MGFKIASRSASSLVGTLFAPEKKIAHANINIATGTTSSVVEIVQAISAIHCLMGIPLSYLPLVALA